MGENTDAGWTVDFFSSLFNIPKACMAEIQTPMHDVMGMTVMMKHTSM